MELNNHFIQARRDARHNLHNLSCLSVSTNAEQRISADTPCGAGRVCPVIAMHPKPGAAS